MDAFAGFLYDSNMSDPTSHQILNFNLFGEVGDLPDVAHCEPIAARSKLHNWEFAPHRHARLHQFLFLEFGGGTARVEGTNVELPPGTLVNVPIGCVHGFSFHPGTEGLVVTLAAETLDETLQPGEGLRPALAKPAVLPAATDCVATMRLIMNTFSGRAFARAQILRSAAGLLLGQIARALAERSDAANRPGTPALLRRFEDLVERHFTDHLTVSDYARRLAVTPTHLSRVARTATGRPASRLIEERVVREARRNLVYTGLSVSTIAYALGFSDPAYFSRVFQRATGLSPRDFRMRMAEGSPRYNSPG